MMNVALFDLGVVRSQKCSRTFLTVNINDESGMEEVEKRIETTISSRKEVQSA